MATVYTSAGEEKVVDIIDGTASSPADLGTGNSFVAWGTGGGGAVKGDTTLTTEASESRVGATVSQPVADKNQWVAEITADGTKTIDEAGLFDASTAGTLVIRGDFTGVAVVLGDKIEFTFTLEQT
jgi:hypothetical protein